MTERTAPLDVEALLKQQEWLRRLVRRLVKDENRVDDVMQETWVRALQSAPIHPNALRTWIRVVVRRLVRDQNRAEAGRLRRERVLSANELVSSTAEFVEHETARRCVSDAVLALREPFRSTVLLRYFEGLPPRQIARRLDVPVATVHSRLRRGHDEIRAQLDRRYGGDRRAWCLALLPLLWPPPTLFIAGVRTKILLEKAGVPVGKAISWIAVLLLCLLGFRLCALPRPGEDERLFGRREPVDLPAAQATSPFVPSDPSRQLAVEADSGLRSTAGITELFGTLVVYVQWESDGSAASNVGVNVVATRAPNALQDQGRLTTDSEGFVRIERVRVGLTLIQVDRGGNADVLVEPGGTNTVSISIPTGFTVKGKVQDPYGRAIEAASIRLTDYANTSWDHEVARSAADGSFEIHSVSSGHHVGAVAPGYARSNLRHLLAASGEIVDVTLVLGEPGGELSGFVADERGSPIAEAWVLILPEVPEMVSAGWNVPADRKASPVRTRTDAGGRFRASGLPIGLTPIAVRAETFAPERVDVIVSTERSTDVFIQLRPGAAISGTVRFPDGRSASRVRVAAGGLDQGFLSSSVRTNENGEFRLEGLPEGPITVQALDESGGRAATTLHTVAGSDVKWDPLLDTGLLIEGQVVDESCAPRIGWHILVTSDLPEPGARAYPHAAPKTDVYGRFVLANCQDVLHTLGAIDPTAQADFPSASRRGVRPGVCPVILVVREDDRATAYIEGNLVDANGTPLGGVPLTVRCGPLSSTVQTTDSQTGHFRFGPLPPSRYGLWTASKDSSTQILPDRDLLAGDICALGPIQLP